MTHIKSSQKHKSHRNQGLIFLNSGLLLIIAGLAAFYVIQVNGLVGASFRVRSEKEKMEETKALNQQFETTVAKLQSPLNLEEKIKGLGMIEANKVDYLKIEKEVAVRK